MTQEQQELLYRLFSSFNEYCPERVLAHRLEQFKSRIADAHFAWIGAIGDDEPYYYRIHSPVAFMEFDFHCGGILIKTSQKHGSGLIVISSISGQRHSGQVSYTHDQPTS